MQTNKMPGMLRLTGKIWLRIAIALIIISYCLNLIISDQPFVERFLSFINFWNVLIALILIIPGFLLTELSEKLENRNKGSKPT
jgi:hypothetical protein